MIPVPGQRSPYPGTAGYHHAPNAALLIDFDNVTMGIRSDLGKELKSLLKSDVIRGKVAVQRAYADWRRYPQYIVPLTESSIDLIFAPAYGSSKKNATDLRMAIDAIELVFTRPEIGTFILMTGDSDFSSCVLSDWTCDRRSAAAAAAVRLPASSSSSRRSWPTSSASETRSDSTRPEAWEIRSSKAASLSWSGASISSIAVTSSSF